MEQDEREHSNYRRIVNPVYTLSNVLKNKDYISKVSALFLKRLGEFADRKQTIDLGEWLQMYTFDVIGEIFFGDMFGFLQNSEDHGGLIESLDTLMPVLAIAGVALTYMRPLVQASAIVITGALKAVGAIEGISGSSRAATGRRLRDIEGGFAHRNDLLQLLFDIVHEKGEKVNFGPDEVKLEGCVAMCAGSDTTAIAFRTTFYHLMRNPRALMKAIEEIEAAVADGSLSSPIKYSETTTKLPYVCASIKEAMHMHPSVARSMSRHASDEGIQLADKFVPRGYRVGMNPAVVHYDQSVLGEDADEYRPERWLVSEEERRVMEKCLLTFGGGTRTCIGENISLVEIYTLVPEIHRQFELKMTHDRQWTTTNRWFQKQTGMTVELRRRRYEAK